MSCRFALPFPQFGPSAVLRAHAHVPFPLAVAIAAMPSGNEIREAGRNCLLQFQSEPNPKAEMGRERASTNLPLPGEVHS